MLVFAVSCAVDLFDLAGVEIPDMEVPAAAGGEDFVARWGSKCGGVDWGASDMERCEKWIRDRGIRGDMMEEESRCRAGREKKGVMRMEGQRVDRGLLIYIVSSQVAEIEVLW